MTLANIIRNVGFMVVISWHRVASFGRLEPLAATRRARGRWPLRNFPLLVDSEPNIVEASIIVEYCSSRIQGQCICCGGDSDIPGPPSDPPETPHPERHYRPGRFIEPGQIA
jgi:hypothetical protein